MERTEQYKHSNEDSLDAVEEQLRANELSDYRRRKFGRVVSKIVLGTYITLTPLQILQADIEINKMNQEVSTPSIHSILEAKDSDNTDKATVFIDGFASQDGSWTTKKIADTLQIVNDSDIWALEFSKNRISVPAIAEQIAHKAEHEKVTSVSLYGYSIGGMISLEVAHELIKK
jgi:pimeloyl-ACP methyl ester carboxylesterase